MTVLVRTIFSKKLLKKCRNLNNHCLFVIILPILFLVEFSVAFLPDSSLSTVQQSLCNSGLSMSHGQAQSLSVDQREKAHSAPAPGPHSARRARAHSDPGVGGKATIEQANAGEGWSPRQRIDLAQWEEQRKRLCTKGIELSRRGHKKSRDAVTRLIESLDTAIPAFNSGIIGRQDFEEVSKEAFREAHQRLDQHRGWSELLASIANWVVAIVSIGMIPLGRMCMGYQPGLFQACPTKSSVLLDEIAETLPNMVLQSEAPEIARQDRTEFSELYS